MSLIWRTLACAFSVVVCLAIDAERALIAADAVPTAKTNIVLIMADDLGYGDLGSYGQRLIRTPYLDRMAAGGMRFTNFYAGSTVCAPSRNALLTGRHTGHIPVRGNVEVLMNNASPTIADVLKKAGYETACIGKWGVGHPPPPGDPQAHGFDYFYGYLDMWHAHNYFPDFLYRNNEKVHITGNVVQVIGKGGVAIKRAQYSHDLFTKEALGFIRRSAESEKPFFLYLPYTIPHANNEAKDKGMEVPTDAPYTPQTWKQVYKNHAAMITRLDRSVEDILQLLKELKIDESTIVFFTSDNGPHKEGGTDPARFDSSGGLNGYKRSLHDGGIRVPLIVRWPGQIKEDSTAEHISASWDLLPTIAEIAGAEAPEGIDGISFLPTLVEKPNEQKTHKYLYWEFHERGSQQAVRAGDWKAIRATGQPTRLYNLNDDPAESTDIAEKHPDVIKQVEAYFAEAHTESELFPLKPAAPKPAVRTPAVPKPNQQE